MDYKQTIDEAKRRFNELAAKRSDIDREMQGLLQIIRGAEIVVEPSERKELTELAESPTNLESVGFTDKVRLVLSRSTVPLTPTEVRDGLEIMNVEGASPKHILIHVHNVMRRLLENGEIAQAPREGKMAYKVLSPWEHLANVFKAPYPLMSAASPTRGIKKE